METNQNADILDARDIALEEKYTFIETFSNILKFYCEALYYTIKETLNLESQQPSSNSVSITN